MASLWALIALPLLIPSFQCPSVRFAHQPCPGCGVTRAWLLLFKGELGASLALHPLAIPSVLAEVAFAIVSLGLAFRIGVPWAAFEERSGRISLYAVMGVMTLTYVLWLARGCGAFGGPVPI